MTECPATSRPHGGLGCNLRPHANDPTSSHWDAEAGIWWQSDTEHKTMVAANREAAESTNELGPDIESALRQLAAEILAAFTKGQDGYRARAGQVQIRKWRDRLDGTEAQPVGADAEPGDLYGPPQ